MNSLLNCFVFDSIHLLARQGDAAPADGGGPAEPAPFIQQLFSPMNLVLFSLIMFFLLVVRPQKNEMKKLQGMLSALKKNDRVVTSGGIHGVVVQANSGDPTIVLRIDESSGAKLTVNRDAITKVLNSETEPDKKS
jgi:preprotein translocase subunit YajC